MQASECGLPTATPVATFSEYGTIPRAEVELGPTITADCEHGTLPMAEFVQAKNSTKSSRSSFCDRDCWLYTLVIVFLFGLPVVLLSCLAPSPPPATAQAHDHRSGMLAAGNKTTTTIVSATQAPPHHPTHQAVAHDHHSELHEPTKHSAMVATLNMRRAVDDPLMDEIGLISDPVMARRIRGEIRSADSDVTGCDMQVLIVDDVPAGVSTKKFATDLFNRWHLGTGDDYAHNNGVLILFLKRARRIEVEVGAGLAEEFMDEAWTRDMLRRRAVPEFKEGRYGMGIYNVVTSCTQRLRDAQAGRAVPHQESSAMPSQESSEMDDLADSVSSFIYFFLFACIWAKCSQHCGQSGGHRSSSERGYDDYGGSSSFDGGGFSSGDAGGGVSW